MIERFATHEVTNQPPPLADYNLYATDRALAEAVEREGAAWAHEGLTDLGGRLGRADTLALGEAANRHPPELRVVDRQGRRVDRVEFHPAWHELMALAMGAGLHGGPWADPRPGAHVARAAAYLLYGQVENGTQCPITMTYGGIPVLRREAWLPSPWLPALLSRRYDPRLAPVGEKAGALVGMGMTEKQGGSDVRTNTTRAEPVSGGGRGREYRLVGHKWFLSAPMCDAFLVLAQAPGGLSCFFLPRVLPDGSLNALRLQRLKDKVGNRSNASSEAELHDAAAWLVGDEGRGVPTIIEMAAYTRLDCALGSAALMRQAVAQALHHAGHRRAFGRSLADQPLMRTVLADLALESEAATALALRVARTCDEEEAGGGTALRRLLTPVAKFWICKRGPAVAAEAMEVLGGNGYVEDWPLGRIYRETPLNSIWEGSGNVMCLDVLRTVAREPEAVEHLEAELAPARGGDRRLDRALAALRDDLVRPGAAEAGARRLVERLALALQGALLVRFAPPAVADAFCASRLGERWSGAFGTLPADLDLPALVARAAPTGSGIHFSTFGPGAAAAGERDAR
jgi:putative acyl-CoA dehydrogenase